MHALVCTAVATAAFLVATITSAADPSPSAADAAKSAANTATATAGAQQSADHGQAAPNNQSRVRRYNGRWWYAMPDNRWMVWQQNAWVAHTPGMFAGDRSVASNRATRRYSYSPGMSSGYPRVYRAPGAYGDSRSIRYAGSKANFDYAPYTGGSVQ